jgi:hypothetical protein
MHNQKCADCGLLNFATVSVCRRCGGALDAVGHVAETYAVRRSEFSLGKALRRSLLLGLFLLAAGYASLLNSSQPLTPEQKQTVDRAIKLLEEKGFTADAALLRYAANFRATDNWWNRWVGHSDAYASTNFPFEVVTLYPIFFTRTADDTERAVVLLHEAQHLRGYGERAAHAEVWKNKHRLGWVRDQYGGTKVWNNVREFTVKYAPEVFSCGADGLSDCVELGRNVKP